MESEFSDSKEKEREAAGQEMRDASNEEEQPVVAQIEENHAPPPVASSGNSLNDSESGNENPAPEPSANTCHAHQNVESDSSPQEEIPSSAPQENDKGSVKPDGEAVEVPDSKEAMDVVCKSPASEIHDDMKPEAVEVPDSKEDMDIDRNAPASSNHLETADATADAETETESKLPEKPTTSAKTEAYSDLPQATDAKAEASSELPQATDSKIQAPCESSQAMDAKNEASKSLQTSDAKTEPSCEARQTNTAKTEPSSELPQTSNAKTENPSESPQTTVAKTENSPKSPQTKGAETEFSSGLPQSTNNDDVNAVSTKCGEPVPVTPEPVTPHAASTGIKVANEKSEDLKNGVEKTSLPMDAVNGNTNTNRFFLLDENQDGSESGTEEEQAAFMKELENFFKEKSMEFKPPRFYGEGLNCLKLWRAVTRLGGYDKVTSCKLWRQVGESFKPPKTCTTVSWTFRGFYEKALLDYERHKLNIPPVISQSEPMNVDNQASGSGRARRDAAARAMQGWHSQRILSNGEVSDPIIKDKNSASLQKREKQLKSIGLLKRKKPLYLEQAVKNTQTKISKPQLDIAVVDIGAPADWVKINVQKTKDCFEVYALVPGLLREEVRVQSDPAGRLVISGEPEHPDNPWGVTPFKKVVSLPSRIDPHQTSAVVTLHGQLFVRVPFEQTE